MSVDESDRLRIAAQDERARRRWAERELAAEAERARLWRKRAEERTARIQILESRLDKLREQQRSSPLRSAVAGLRRLLRGGGGSKQPEPAPTPKPTVQPEPTAEAQDVASPGRHRRPAYPHIRIAALGANTLPVLGEFDTCDLAAQPDAVFDSDIVWLSASSWASCPDDTRTALEAWVKEAGRQPLVVWQDEAIADRPSILGDADVRLAPPGNAAELIEFHPGCQLSPDAAPLQRWLSLFAVAGAVGELSEEQVRAAVAARRVSLRNNSPVQRAAELIRAVGIESPHPSREVGALLVSNKPDLIIPAVESMLLQQNVDMHLVVGLHGREAAFADVRERLDGLLSGRKASVFGRGDEVTLGECLNVAAATCRSPVMAKIDDDDYYGPHYLEDAVAALALSDADVAGKARYFVELQDSRDVFLVRGTEEDFADHVIGSSLTFRRSIWEMAPFPHRPSRVDSIFLRSVRTVGGSIYSTHRFEFAVRRGGDRHTWSVDPGHFAARGERVGSSLEDVRVDVGGEQASRDD